MKEAPRRPVPIWLVVLIGLMYVMWTANFLIGKVALREFPPFVLSGLRFTVAFLGSLPFYWFGGGEGKACARRDWPMLLLLGIVGIGLNQGLFVLGLSKTSVAHSSIMVSTTPLFVLLMAAYRGLEAVTLRKVAGVLAAMVGIAILAMERHGGPGPTLAGDLLTLGGAASFAFYTVMGKEINHRYSGATVNAIVYGAAALFFLPLMMWQGQGFAFDRVTNTAWLSMLYMGVFPSLVAYMIYYHALGYIAASRMATLSFLQPVMATAFGVLLLGERLTATLVIGGAIVFTGVYLTQRGA